MLSQDLLKKLGVLGVSVGLMASPLAFAGMHEEPADPAAPPVTDPANDPTTQPPTRPRSPPIRPRSPPIRPRSPPIRPRSPPIRPRSPPIRLRSPPIRPLRRLPIRPAIPRHPTRARRPMSPVSVAAPSPCQAARMRPSPSRVARTTGRCPTTESPDGCSPARLVDAPAIPSASMTRPRPSAPARCRGFFCPLVGSATLGPPATGTGPRSVAVEAAIESAPGDSQDIGGAALVAAGGVQHLADIALLDLFEAGPGPGRGARHQAAGQRLAALAA
jgi:hypothetical protein